MGNNYIDNGDGTTTVNGFKIAKPFGMNAPKAPAGPSAGPATSLQSAPLNVPGLGVGNIDLANQPRVKNPDGSISTVDSSSYNIDGQEVLLPSVTPDGRHLKTDDQILGEYRKTGRHLGKFPDAESATAYATQLHDDYAAGKYGGQPVGSPSAPDPQTAAIVNQLQRSGQAPMTVQPSQDQPGGGQQPSMTRSPGMVSHGGGVAIPQSSGPRVIDPGGMKTVAETTQKGTPIPAELKQQREDAMLTQRAANQSNYEASAAEGEQTGEAARQYADETQQRLAEEQQRAVEHQQTLQEAQQKLEQMQADYRSKPVNDDTYWQEKGAGAKMAAGIWVTLGQLSQQMTHTGENIPKSVIDKQVDSWVTDKKERRGIALQGQQSAIANTRENFASEAAQNAALRAQAYDAYRAKLGAIVGENAPDKLKAQANQLDGELQQKSADWAIQAANAEADHVTTQSKLVGPTVVGGGGPKPLDRGLVVQDINGGKYLARDVEQARDLNKKLALTKQADSAAKKMAEIADKSAGEKIDPNSPLGKEFGFAREQFTNSMNGLQEQGVVRGDDIKRYEEYTGGAYGLSTAQAARKLASKATTAYQYHLDSKADTESPVDEEFGTNAAGQTDKYAHYRMAPGSNGQQIPIAVPYGSKRKKKGVSFTPLGDE